MAEIAEPVGPPRVLAEPKRYAALRAFSCGGRGQPWEKMVNEWAKRLYRGAPEETVLTLEDADRRLIGLCSFKAQAVVAGTAVGKRAQRIHMIGVDRHYRGKLLGDGSRPADLLLDGALKQIGLVCGGMPAVSALVDPENEPSHALFERNGFQRLPYRGEGEAIWLRPPDKRLSLVRLQMWRSRA